VPHFKAPTLKCGIGRGGTLAFCHVHGLRGLYVAQAFWFCLGGKLVGRAQFIAVVVPWMNKVGRASLAGLGYSYPLRDSVSEGGSSHLHSQLASSWLTPR
jgi:hypothetical protein